jgi:hypothetical protein
MPTPVSYLVEQSDQIRFERLDDHYVKVWLHEGLSLEGDPRALILALEAITAAIAGRCMPMDA